MGCLLRSELELHTRPWRHPHEPFDLNPGIKEVGKFCDNSLGALLMAADGPQKVKTSVANPGVSLLTQKQPASPIKPPNEPVALVSSVKEVGKL